MVVRSCFYSLLCSFLHFTVILGYSGTLLANPDHDGWGVSWGKFLAPEEITDFQGDLDTIVNIEPSAAVSNPNQYRYATFWRYFPDDNSTLQYGLTIPKVRAAVKVWVNGELILQRGMPGKNEESESIAVVPSLLPLKKNTEGYNVVLHVSGFAFRWMGPVTPILFGEYNQLKLEKEQAQFRDTFVLSSILIMAFYHFAIFLLRPSRREALYFAAFCAGVIGMTTINGGGKLIFYFFPNTPVELYYRLDFICFPSAIIALTYFCKSLYPKQIWQRMVQVSIWSSSIFALTAMLAPFLWIDALLQPYQIIVLSGACVYLTNITRAALQKEPDAWLFLSGFIIIVFGGVNDILKTNGLDLPTVSHLTLFAFIFIQSIILSLRFSRAFDRLEVAETEIRQLNSNLEMKVQERTATIRMILDHVKSGFMLIDSSLKLEPGFTKSCAEILGRDIEEGALFSKLFAISDQESHALDLSFEQVFEDFMPEMVTLGQIPSRLPASGKIIRLQASVIRNGETSAIEHILITLTDATELAKMESEVKITQSLLKILQSLTNFKSLLAETFDEFERSSNLLEQQGQKDLKMLLHTIKGNFSSYGLDEIACLAHEIEDHDEITQNDIERLIRATENFLDFHKDILRIDLHTLKEHEYILRDQHFSQLLTELEKEGVSASFINRCRVWVDQVKKVSLRDLLGPVEKSVERIADSIGKRAILHFEGDHVLVDRDSCQVLIHSLIHVIRNSLDHGLESPSERGDKSENGQLFIKAWHADAKLHIDIGDDGRGMDPERLRSVAVTKGVITPEEAATLSDEDSYYLIFRPGFSTAEEVSSLSGRGVGMSAVYDAVLSLQGELKIASELGKGVCFHISIPEHQDKEEQNIKQLAS